MPRTHASLPRLHIEPDLTANAQLTLGKDQSLYLAAVLRKSVGDEVVLFNGRDGAWLARLATDSKKSVTLDLVEQIAPQTPAYAKTVQIRWRSLPSGLARLLKEGKDR